MIGPLSVTLRPDVSKVPAAPLSMMMLLGNVMLLRKDTVALPANSRNPDPTLADPVMTRLGGASSTRIVPPL